MATTLFLYELYLFVCFPHPQQLSWGLNVMVYFTFLAHFRYWNTNEFFPLLKFMMRELKLSKGMASIRIYTVGSRDKGNISVIGYNSNFFFKISPLCTYTLKLVDNHRWQILLFSQQSNLLWEVSSLASKWCLCGREQEEKFRHRN